MEQAEIDVINAYIKNLSEKVQNQTVELLYQKSRMQCLEVELTQKNEAINELQELLAERKSAVNTEESEGIATGGFSAEESISEYSIVEESVSEYSSAPISTASITPKPVVTPPQAPRPRAVQQAPKPAPSVSANESPKMAQTLGSEQITISDGGEYNTPPKAEPPKAVSQPVVEEKPAKVLSTRGKGDRSKRRRRRREV
jgi:hypothetical protein